LPEFEPSKGNIILVGFMGCGKTTVGRTLAAKTGRTFVDSDTEIVREMGVSIADLFGLVGEAEFRNIEAQVVARVCQGVNQIIATGGGAILRENNRHNLHNAGMVVWLTARPETIVERVQKGRVVRPLLAKCGSDTEKMRAHIMEMLGERGPLYQQTAHMIIDTSDMTIEAITRHIERQWQRWQAEQLPLATKETGA
jgi:shikimate kinase